MNTCPYCGVGFSLDGVDCDYSFPRFGRFHPYATTDKEADLPDDCKKKYSITSHRCPECKRQIMWMNELVEGNEGGTHDREIAATVLLFPKRAIKLLPSEVPDQFKREFIEANDTLEISPKASAALSRRCLQSVIRQQEGLCEKTLFAEIDKLLKLNKLPKYLADDLDSIRNVGNFAAHPIKDTNTGEIVDVEVGEAEWNLEVLEELLLFYFVEAGKSQARRAALNKKLTGAGKPPMLTT